jgi:uncharacterized cysteine cluster protein YcgN (CxxCxxCC family)
MGELRERFWELPLGALGRAEWEALCDGCGRCCLHKLEDDESGEVAETNVACKLLDPATARCTDYRHRKAYVPDCLRLTLKLVDTVPWLPESCAYRRRADGLPLPRWHHLLTGDRSAMIEAGACVAGKVVSETEAGPLEHHLVVWEEDA